MKRTLLGLVCSTGLALTPAAVRADEVDTLGGKVTELDARVYELNQQLKPPPEPGPELAERRLIDAQVLYELKNYEAASIILFDVVEKFPNAQAYSEALFYLADSLYLKRDFLSSRRYFEKIVDVGPQHRRYQEALQRLIELSLHTGDYSPVDGYIAKLEAQPAAQQLPSVPYVKGKYFYFRKQYDKALEAFQPIGADHKYYFHATYFAGAAAVAQGPEKWDEAVQRFGLILKQPPQTDAQRRIAELAHLALARIYLERGQLIQALDAYSKIDRKSSHFNDMLYESAWVAIKGKDYTKARRQLDLLLLNAPDSPLAPEVKLLTGSLHIRQSEYGPATDTFTKTRDEFEPIHRQLADELAKTPDAPAYFRDLIQRNLNKFEIAAILPRPTVRWLKDEADVKKLEQLIDDEGELRKSLDEAAEIVKRLEKTLNSPARVNVFPELAQARAKAREIQHELHDMKKQLAEREAKLIAPVAGAEKSELDRIEQSLADLRQRLAGVPAKQAALEERQTKARTAFNDLDKRASEIAAEVTGLKKAVDAARRLYEEQVSKPGEPQQMLKLRAGFSPGGAPLGAATTVEPNEPAPAPQRSYDQAVAELDTRLKSARAATDKAKQRVDKLKELVLDRKGDAKGELEGAWADVQAIDQALGELRSDVLEAATAIGVDDSDMQAAARLRAEHDELLKRQHALVVQVQSRLGGAERAKLDQIMSILERVGGVEQKLTAFNGRIDTILDARLKDIQATLVDEKAHMIAYRETLNGYGTESADVGGHVVAENFKNVAARFYNIVVRADVGIIDVAWALKDASTKETNRLVAERKRELKLLDDEFKEVLKEQP